tara:strand:+ start:5610 stop:8702 length:3093 start_codon:yes stop_codon:yes gene_type:complete
MSVGLNTGGVQAFGMQGPYKPNVASTAKLRVFLLGKNLQSSYLSDSNPIPAPFGIQQPGKQNTNIYEQSVIDQKTVQELAPQNLVNLFLDNSYGPEGGYLDVQTINVKKVLPRRGLDYVTQNTLQPKSFVSSEYTSAEIFKTVNITNGMVNTLNSKILNDSELVQKSSGNLRKQLGYNQGWNDLDLSDKGSFMFNVSVNPGEKELDGTDYLSRITNLYYGYSNIPGNYFNGIFKPDINFLAKNGISTMAGTFGNIQATANAVASLLTGGDNVPTNAVSNPVPSDRFITYMGEEQQKALFTSLDFNKYRPDYSRVQLRQGVTNVTPYYYIGSKSNEPSKIQSPMGAIPQDEFGRPINALVYGPSTLAKQLETVDGKQLWPYYMFGLRGYTYNDGGSLAGGWTWMGSRSFASTNAPYDLLATRSFQKPLRKGGILDQTQKLIDAAPLMGGARRKHAGHAIDQTSKIFSDGYKEISKGSGVKFVDESNGVFGIGGGLVAREFCRTWTKDDPYWKMDNLQKHKGNHLGKAGSVLTNTFNLNIAPIFGVNVDTEKTEKNVSKYMFSIENLAWRGTSELLGLPKSEKGPNGGRVMWFPPYDLQVGDTNSAQWNSVNFLGRPEPIYTYNYTERIGTLNWKIVVDHPSILNVITENTLKGVPDYVADQALEAFFAGCKEYDVYELASIFPNLSVDDIISIQNDITDEYNSDPETTVGDNTSGVDTPINPDPSGIVLDGGVSADASIIDLDGGSTVGSESTIPDNVQNTEMGGSWNAFDASNPGETQTDETQATANNQAGAGKEKKLDTAKILAKMLGEENYFNALKQDDEFIYNSLKRELKHFHPSFHSMTPEGLNNRLSFLLQCTRPGNTIPTVNTDGSLDTERDVDNTAFGAPPICVLRIGDFYHTKIAIDSVSFSYDPLIYDLNPEGIGVQPMIANVSMNFKYIGGQGLEAPVSELQNALSNNFFANTEMYNNNSVKTTTDKQKPVTDEQEIIAEMEAQQAAASQGSSDGTNTEGSSTDGEQSGNLWQNFWGTGP